MAALVQSYPQQSGTVTMLQTRPATSGMIQSASQNQGHHQYSSSSHMHRNSYHNLSGIVGSATYRGHTTTAPVAPYAFTSTPSLTNFRQQPSPYLRADQKNSSTTLTPTLGNLEVPQGGNRARYPAEASVSTTSSSSSSDQSSPANPNGAVDDSALPPQNPKSVRTPRPQSMVLTPRPHSMILTSAPSSPISLKPSPDRYRRGPNRHLEPAGQSSPSVRSSISISSGSSGSTPSNQLPTFHQVGDFPGSGSQPRLVLPQNAALSAFEHMGARRSASDDLLLQRPHIKDDPNRYRRRSIHNLDSSYASQSGNSAGQWSGKNGHVFQQGGSVHPLRSSPVTRPSSSPERQSNVGNTASSRRILSTPSSAKRESAISVGSANPAPHALAAVEAIPKHEQNQYETTPPGALSSDLTKSASSASPLSKLMMTSPQSPLSKDSVSSAVSAAQTPTQATNSQGPQNGVKPSSPAAKQLAALNNKEVKKTTASRLRRAFSFGSAAELKKASIENSAASNGANAARLRKERHQNEKEVEQERIVQKQEDGGLGTGIYSNQGHVFSGSTDNLSISSTASSASIMIRKMGSGMKKSTRSLVGLFRPKSVIGVPAADSAVEPSLAQVSMVTVEAEREMVNTNANTHDQVSGGAVYPKLERDSLEAATATSLESNDSSRRENAPIAEAFISRRSLHGGERERAEVLASVKKGILKRSGSESGNSSPVVRAIDPKMPNFNLPLIPHVNDSPLSSAPSTPTDDISGHKRTGSVTLGTEDYFMSALKFRGDSKSMPGTPLGTLKRNATFSPRIQFHDTWPSGEYDRRGEIATCNRLTPMLAQQIKEELNTFKMEMEVHENSKVYTHFF